MDANEMKKQQVDFEQLVRCMLAREEKDRLRKARLEQGKKRLNHEIVPSKSEANVPPLVQHPFPENNILKGFRRW
jgi:NAD(P)H-flavin reductase